jgi:hypothetical protein
MLRRVSIIISYSRRLASFSMIGAATRDAVRDKLEFVAIIKKFSDVGPNLFISD